MSNAGYIRNGLLQRGMPGYVADAFIENFRDESGLNPGINEAKPLVPGSRGGFGLFQSTGPRRRALEGVAADRGLPASDIDTQLDVLTAELGMPGTGLDNYSWFGSEARAAGRIFGAKDTATAAQAIVNDFLRPSPEHRRSRTARYASLTGSAASAPGATMSDATSFFPNERMPSSLDRAPSSGASPMVSNYGSLGGLGGYSSAPERPAPEPGIRGFIKSDGFGDWLGAMGASLMSSPGNAPLQNMPTLLANAQDNRSRAEERAFDREERRDLFNLGRQDRLEARQWELQDREAARQNALYDARMEREAADLQNNRTYNFALQDYPEVARMMEAGLPANQAFTMMSEAHQNAGKVPDLETFYDEATGREYKGYMNPATGQPVRVGGLKAAPQGDAGVVVSPDGTVTVGGPVGDREILARQYGLDPASPEGRSYILTGNLPSGDRGVTAQDRVAIREADDLVMTGTSAIETLMRARDLSSQAYQGPGSGARAVVGGVFGLDGAEATIEFNNLIKEQALGQLKAIFGGAPTEGERAILLEIQGSSNQPQAVRDRILERAISLAERRVAFNRDRATELRGGTYYDPREESQTVPAVNGSETSNPRAARRPPEPVVASPLAGGRTAAPETEPSGAMPMVTNDAQFDALPSGALFVGADGKTRRKP